MIRVAVHAFYWHPHATVWNAQHRTYIRSYLSAVDLSESIERLQRRLRARYIRYGRGLLVTGTDDAIGAPLTAAQVDYHVH